MAQCKIYCIKVSELDLLIMLLAVTNSICQTQEEAI